MNKKYLLIPLGAFLLIIASVGIIYALTTVTQGEQVTLYSHSQCSQDAQSVKADLDASDGFVRYLYGAWALKDPLGNIIQQQGPTQKDHGDSAHSGSATFIADELGKYRLTVEIFYVEQQYNSTSFLWETVDSGACGTLNGDSVTVTYPQPDVSQIVSVINQLFQDWINSL